MVFITRKGRVIQEQILECIEQEEAPISTRQLALKLGYAWHTLQQRCLELQIKGKISHVQIAGSHLWTKIQTTVFNNSEINTTLNSQLNAVLEQQIKKLTEELAQIKEKKDTHTENPIEETL